MEILKQAGAGILIGAIAGVTFFIAKRAVVQISDLIPIKEGDKK